MHFSISTEPFPQVSGPMACYTQVLVANSLVAWDSSVIKSTVSHLIQNKMLQE